jgi:fumarylacetoacetase
MQSTTSPGLCSFVPTPAESHFPIQNLPYGVFRPRTGGTPRVGVAIGEMILDLSALESRSLLKIPGVGQERGPIFARPSLNAFMALGRDAWRGVRAQVSRLLSDQEPLLRDNAALRKAAFLPMADAEMLLPVEIGDYTDFYSSKDHASNVGAMFRGPENALPPNWLHLPIAYHGRASSVVASGTDLHRPSGQTKPEGAESPTFGPSQAVDFELEMGYFIGPGNRLGEPIPAEQTMEHVFGLVLVNDWSARDIQRWEYVPLGPFLAKNFGTSISPWVVTLEALEPCGTHGDQAYDIHLQVTLQTAAMSAPQTICNSNSRNLYWSIAQQIAHHTVNGCNLRTGDLLASGTISGPTPDSRGCLLELTWGGRQPLELAGGETRRFLADGDRVTMTAWCEGAGYRVGFGEVTGRILPAI